MRIRRNHVGLSLTSDGKAIKYQRNVNKEGLAKMLEIVMEQDPVLKEVVEMAGKKPDLVTTVEWNIPSDAKIEWLKEDTVMEPGKIYLCPKETFKHEEGGKQ